MKSFNGHSATCDCLDCTYPTNPVEAIADLKADIALVRDELAAALMLVRVQGKELEQVCAILEKIGEVVTVHWECISVITKELKRLRGMS